MFAKSFVFCVELLCCWSVVLQAIPLEHLPDRDIVLQLVRQNDVQQAQIDELKQLVQEQQKTIDGLQADGSRVFGNNVPKRRSRRAGDPRSVEAAFTATTFNVVHHLANDATVNFANVSVNLGGHYNVADGTFVAPVTGYYVISATIMSIIDAELVCEIVVNDVSQATLYAKGDTNWHDQGSQTIAVRMSQGDRALVRSLVKDGDVYGLASSSFSGFLLYQDQAGTTLIG